MYVDNRIRSGRLSSSMTGMGLLVAWVSVITVMICDVNAIVEKRHDANGVVSAASAPSGAPGRRAFLQKLVKKVADEELFVPGPPAEEPYPADPAVVPEEDDDEENPAEEVEEIVEDLADFDVALEREDEDDFEAEVDAGVQGAGAVRARGRQEKEEAIRQLEEAEDRMTNSSFPEDEELQELVEERFRRTNENTNSFRGFSSQFIHP